MPANGCPSIGPKVLLLKDVIDLDPKHWLVLKVDSNQTGTSSFLIWHIWDWLRERLLWVGSGSFECHNTLYPIGLLPDTNNCGLRMRRECRERFPRHPHQRNMLVSELKNCHFEITSASPRRQWINPLIWFACISRFVICCCGLLSVWLPVHIYVTSPALRQL